MKENKEQLRSAEGHSPDYVKGFNDAIDQALMLMQINPWHADEKITRGYAYAVHDKAKEIHRMRFASQFKPSGVKTEWISVKDEWPLEIMPVLWCRVPVDEPYLVASMCDEGFDETYWTHWMPLPQSPK